MVAAGAAIATRLVVKKAITSCNMVAIPPNKYTKEEACALERFLVATTKHAPTTVGHSAHGHVCLLKDTITYIAKCTDVDYTKAPAPSTFTFTNGATNIIFVQEKENVVANAETYHT